MPDLSLSVEVDGKYFCLDKKTGVLYEVKAEYIPVKVAPEISQAIKKLFEKAELLKDC